ncbi:hypothetical protein M378DRAFT_180846 [Amanita muscaria Koide BX008]|uniref:Uncharacterized protein n=1 Tax=Amanita muscaria (strain Koide BX008) TaxID=946122 RepID=A0A0C2WST4_AMAMK|nr:hypothetical protein M378DRAFT_180846 [Amanita muscaria Koide BX008]
MGDEGFPSLPRTPSPDNDEETMSNNSLEEDTRIDDHDDETNSETQDLEEGDDQVPFEDYDPSDEETQFDIRQTRSSCDKLAQSQEMIDAIREARFEDDMDDAMLSRMMDPPRSQPDINYSTQISIRNHGGPPPTR